MIFTCHLVYSCYHCYLLFLIFLIFHVPEFSLFLLSFEDNHYVDKTLVYKVVSYN